MSVDRVQAREGLAALRNVELRVVGLLELAAAACTELSAVEAAEVRNLGAVSDKFIKELGEVQRALREQV
eukprot:CAMPEP_0198350238 /NCGR_PEP_ID=MMETSP1450-20131203/97988_1 /TAXON_ID=753684 ORGANISM="Madagascaria erythrocladiodes, Strain CCMP3234" /NCGR_SAMPLE_ID=MMETSP1450 /ASSEMBLY_ACC=CAM_ASM_001115 /LENGTH=69 /DNA_ID=CAMNT_0044056019 /DNA_START=446 /DNA_END=652 /DNA_ORIENTATION=+